MKANLFTAAIILTVSAVSYISVDDYPKTQQAYKNHLVDVALVASKAGISASNECITIATKTLYGGRESVTEDEELRSGSCARKLVKVFLKVGL